MRNRQRFFVWFLCLCFFFSFFFFLVLFFFCTNFTLIPTANSPEFLSPAPISHPKLHMSTHVPPPPCFRALSIFLVSHCPQHLHPSAAALSISVFFLQTV